MREVEHSKIVSLNIFAIFDLDLFFWEKAAGGYKCVCYVILYAYCYFKNIL